MEGIAALIESFVGISTPPEDLDLLESREEISLQEKNVAEGYSTFTIEAEWCGRGKKVRVSVPWLKRTQYISAESNEFTQFQRTNLESK